MAGQPRTPPPGAGDPEPVSIGGLHLQGLLTWPEAGAGMVIFAHGSGSSRHSPRNQYVAQVLRHAGLGTLLLDLLLPHEANDRRRVFDIPLLAERLGMATAWWHKQGAAVAGGVGYFGASTGGGAALVAAAEAEEEIAAVVSRGGRPDLAGDQLPRVRAATLLIVGGDDSEVLALNEEAYSQLTCEKRLEIVPGATHLFEEPGKLETVAELAREWLTRHLGVPHSG